MEQSYCWNDGLSIDKLRFREPILLMITFCISTTNISDGIINPNYRLLIILIYIEKYSSWVYIKEKRMDYEQYYKIKIGAELTIGRENIYL